MKSFDEIDIYSEQVTEILSAPTKSILKTGLIIISSFILTLLVLSNFIKYPDNLAFSGNLTATNQPIEVFPKVSSEISLLSVSDKDTIEQGTIILNLKTTAELSDINKLEDLLSQLIQKDYEFEELLSSTNLGELTSLYTDLEKKLKEYNLYYNEKSKTEKIKHLQSEINQTSKLNVSLKRQETYYRDELKIISNETMRSKGLLDSGVIAPSDHEIVEVKLLNGKRNLEGFKSNIINNEVKIAQLGSNIADIEQAMKIKNVSLVLEIKNVTQELLEQIKVWKESYVVKAPCSGIVSFSQNWYTNQAVHTTEPLFTIIPIAFNETYYITGFIPFAGLGNLKKGQEAIVELSNYPSKEYGVLRGKLHDFSLTPTNDMYRVKVEVPKDFITTYNIEIPKSQLMKASVLINTNDYTLLERVFQTILDILRNKNN